MEIGEVDADKRFVPNYPRVVPRRNRTHIARAELCFGTVVHSDHYPPRDDMDDALAEAERWTTERYLPRATTPPQRHWTVKNGPG